MLLFAHPLPVLLWIGACVAIGLIGRNKRFGFLGNFLISMLLTPIVGVIVLMASDDRPRRRVRS